MCVYITNCWEIEEELFSLLRDLLFLYDLSHRATVGNIQIPSVNGNSIKRKVNQES